MQIKEIQRTRLGEGINQAQHTSNTSMIAYNNWVSKTSKQLGTSWDRINWSHLPIASANQYSQIESHNLKKNELRKQMRKISVNRWNIDWGTNHTYQSDSLIYEESFHEFDESPLNRLQHRIRDTKSYPVKHRRMKQNWREVEQICTSPEL